MNEHRSPRSGTIPVPLVPQREIPWFKISIAANVILGLGLVLSLLTRSGSAEDPKAAVEAMVEKSPEEAIGLAAENLQSSEEATRYWRLFLGEQYLKAGKKDQARAHFLWLVKNFPKEAAYKQRLAATSGKPGKKPGKKK